MLNILRMFIKMPKQTSKKLNNGSLNVRKRKKWNKRRYTRPIWITLLLLTMFKLAKLKRLPWRLRNAKTTYKAWKWKSILSRRKPERYLRRSVSLRKSTTRKSSQAFHQSGERSMKTKNIRVWIKLFKLTKGLARITTDSNKTKKIN